MRNALLVVAMIASCSVFSQEVATSVASDSLPAIKKRPKFLVNVNVGPAFRVGKTPSGIPADQKAYIKDLKSGFSYDISAYYLRDSRSGFGLKYNVFNSKGTLRDQELVAPNGDTGTGDTSDDITITFIGPAMIFFGDGFRPRDNFGVEIGLGYIGYVDKAKLLGDYKITGGNLGISSTISYHFGLTENIMIGPAIGFTGGVLSKIKVTGEGISETVKLEDDMKESLYRFDLSIGARFKF